MKTLKPILNQASLLMAGLFIFNSLSACGQATTGAATSSAPTDPAKTTLLQPLQQMVTKLKKLQATGDPDFDYAFQAKIHTQGEQDLLKQAVQTAKDSSLRKMAQTLLTATQADLSTIDGTLQQLKPTRPNQTFSQQQSRNIEAINLKLQQTGSSDKLTGDVDKNVMALLLDQHQDAIDLANTYLQYGKNATLRTFAQQLVTKSQTEMAQIKAMPK